MQNRSLIFYGMKRVRLPRCLIEWIFSKFIDFPNHREKFDLTVQCLRLPFPHKIIIHFHSSDSYEIRVPSIYQLLR